MKFYSQCQEDKILYERYFSKYTPPNGEKQCYYFEMGAMDGITYSNTKFYEETLGWTGVLVEGNPFHYPHCVINRPNNIVMNAICSDQEAPLVFNICTNVPAVCSVEITKPPKFDNEYYQWSQMLQIKTIPVSLDILLERSGVPRIDLCVIDVEGHEVHVLKSFHFRVPVVLWLIEFLDDEHKNDEVKSIMSQHDYQFMEKVAHNAVFIHKQFLHCFDGLNQE